MLVLLIFANHNKPSISYGGKNFPSFSEAFWFFSTFAKYFAFSRLSRNILLFPGFPEIFCLFPKYRGLIYAAANYITIQLNIYIVNIKKEPITLWDFWQLVLSISIFYQFISIFLSKTNIKNIAVEINLLFPIYLYSS